ncbi:hypothetical protein [Vibrio sp. TRT 1302]|uniref:hypothetical protein n=1 Tax=Vibrio sp. TRT 1302 TaxID=3418504 RepID=UPI003CEC3680
MKGNFLKFGLKPLFVAVPAIMFANGALANSGDLTIIGSVSAQTCDISVTSASGGPVLSLDLGTVAASGFGSEVVFHLKPDTSNTACDTTNMNADVTWSGSDLGPNGIENGSGTATGTRALLKAKPFGALDQFITSANPTYTFLGPQMQGDGSLQFAAQLSAGSTAGTYSSTVSYTVSYN